MHYEGAIYRPPSEAKSVILQVTTGCSYNKCLFCGAYKDKTFRIKDERVIVEDIRYASRLFPDANRLFLCDGDVLSVPQERLTRLLESIASHLPSITRIGSYANAGNLARKTVGELAELRRLGLSTVHMGVESGDDATLQSMNKGVTAEVIVEQGKKVKEAGMTLFVTVILGLGGVERSMQHAEKTGEALTFMNPQLVGALSLMPVEGTILYERLLSGAFSLPDPPQILRELRTMLAHTDLRPGTFYSNHASNYLPLKIRMPHEKEHAIALIDSALRGEVPLRPEWTRGL